MPNVTDGQLHKPERQRRLAVVLRWRVRLVSHAKVNANWDRHRLVLARYRTVQVCDMAISSGRRTHPTWMAPASGTEPGSWPRSA